MKKNTNLIRSIPSAEFDSWPSELKVIAHNHARRFAAFKRGEKAKEVALSWRSDIIEPIVVAESEDHSDVWIGVDQRVACVSNDGVIFVSIGLNSCLIDIRRLHRSLAVICETEIILFNDDYSICAIHGMNNIPSELDERDGKMIITFIDGSHSVVPEHN